MMTFANGLNSYSLADFNNATQEAADEQIQADQQVTALAQNIATMNIAEINKQSAAAQQIIAPFVQMGQQGAAQLQTFIGNGQAASTGMNNLLGLNGASGNGQQTTAINNMLNSPMIQSQMQYGMQGVQNSLSAQGLTGSGSAMQQLEGYGQGLAANQIGNYMGGLESQAGLGAQGASSLVNAGATAAGTGASALMSTGTQVAAQNTQMGNTQANSILNQGQVQSNSILSQAQMSLMGAMQMNGGNLFGPASSGGFGFG